MNGTQPLVGPCYHPRILCAAGSMRRREGDWGSVSGVPTAVSGCELSRFLRKLKKRIHIVDEGPGPKLRARNREETLLSGYMRKSWCILFLFHRADANMNTCKQEYQQPKFGECL